MPVLYNISTVNPLVSRGDPFKAWIGKCLVTFQPACKYSDFSSLKPLFVYIILVLFEKMLTLQYFVKQYC